MSETCRSKMEKYFECVTQSIMRNLRRATAVGAVAEAYSLSTLKLVSSIMKVTKHAAVARGERLRVKMANARLTSSMRQPCVYGERGIDSFPSNITRSDSNGER